jgi:hypothetical protein
MADDITEALLITVNTLEEASAIRLHLMSSKGRLWIYVYKDDGRYSVAVHNEYGAKLSAGNHVLLSAEAKKFIEQWRSERSPADVQKVDEDEDDIETVDDLVDLER